MLGNIRYWVIESRVSTCSEGFIAVQAQGEIHKLSNEITSTKFGVMKEEADRDTRQHHGHRRRGKCLPPRG